jgi:multidrug efflux pump subunit AcrA (membrane-fusion protein)
MLEQSKIIVEFWRKRLDNINKRKDRLKKKTKVPMMDMDDLTSQAANVETMLTSAQVMVEQASIKAKQMASVFNYLKMKAPSAGVIVKRNIKVGDMVMPGMLTIMITDTEFLEIHVSVSESIIAKVHVGQQLVVNIPSIKYKTIGTIKAIVPDANPMTHKIQMRISFDQGGQNIFPGMYAKVLIKDKK